MPKKFPKTAPQDSPFEAFLLQRELVGTAETLFGDRTPSLEISQPSFGDSGPHILFSQDGKSMHVQLSPSAAADWRAAAGELSHAALHMLNPKDESTTMLKEGIAAAFAVLIMDQEYGVQFRPDTEPHLSALTLIESLPIAPMAFGLKVRQRFGAFSGFDAADLTEAFPQLSHDTAGKLVAIA